MREYNRIFKEVANRLDSFVKNISQNQGKVCSKFLKDFWNGLLVNQNVLLSEISRGNKRPVLLKKQIERLGNRLASFSCNETLLKNYHKLIQREVNDKTIFCVDNTDIIKPHGNKFENLNFIRDGSTGRIEKGYEVASIVALSENYKQPISLFSYPFSYEEDSYLTNNLETEKALDCLRNSFGSVGVKVFDRGYDDTKLMRYLVQNNEKFVIRIKENRNLMYGRQNFHVLDLIQKPAVVSQNYYTKNKKTYLFKFKKYLIHLCEMKLNLVVVSGFGNKPMLLLTNLNSDKYLERIITKVYILRWKIEEQFRFEKQVFSIENFRIRKLKAIRNLILLTSMLCGFIAIICEHQKSKLFKKLLLFSQTLGENKKKNHLFFYSIARAISELFTFFTMKKYLSSA